MTAQEVLDITTLHGMREPTEARVIQAMTEYARIKCKEQRELCAETYINYRGPIPEITYNDIRRTKTPEII
jgi:hypothetical protein